MSEKKTRSLRRYIVRADKIPSPEEYEENMAALCGLPLDEVEYDPDSGVLWYQGRFDPKTCLILEPYPLGQSDVKWGPKRKRVKTIRHPLKNFADLAVLTRAWRKPIYKNLRYLYVKDGVIVEYVRVTGHGPMNASPSAGAPMKAVKHVEERLVALGASSLFMVHNYDAGFAPPSEMERELAIAFSETVPRLKAHIIINPGWFGLITLKGIAILRVLPDADVDIPGANPALPRTCVIRDDALPKLAAWTKALTQRETPVLISFMDKVGLRGLREINLGDIDKWNQVVDIMALDDDCDEDPSVCDERNKALEVAWPLLCYAGFYKI